MPRANRMNLTGLQHSKQFHLRLKRHFPDFVEEQRAAVGFLEPPDLPFERAGERPLFVPEQLRFDQIGGDRAAIDGDDRLFRAWRSGMDRIGDDFLADAAFPLDQHRHARARCLGGNRQRRAEHRLGADDLVETQGCGNLFGQRAQLSGRLAANGGFQRREHPLGRQRLHQEIGRASAHGVHRLRDGAVRGEHQHRQRRATGAQLGDEAGRIGIRGPMIEDDRIQLHAVLCAEHGNRHFPVAGEYRPPAAARRKRGDEPALRRFIVDQHQQALAIARHQATPHRPGLRR